MTTDCSIELQVQYMKIPSSEHVLPHVLQKEELLTKIYLYRNNGPFQENDGPYQMIPASFIRHILDNGCKYLTICQADLMDGINLPKKSQLKSFAVDDMYGDRTFEAIEEIISTTDCLEICQLDFLGTFRIGKLIKNVCLKNSKTLTVLKLQIATLTLESAISIVYFKELKELSLEYYHPQNLRGMYPEEHEYVNYLVQNISPRIKKISFEGMINFENDQLEMLVTRCKRLEELSLKNTSITPTSVTIIVENCFNLVKLDLFINGLHNFAREEKLLRSLPKLTSFKIRQFII